MVKLQRNSSQASPVLNLDDNNGRGTQPMAKPPVRRRAWLSAGASAAVLLLSSPAWSEDDVAAQLKQLRALVEAQAKEIKVQRQALDAQGRQLRDQADRAAEAAGRARRHARRHPRPRPRGPDRQFRRGRPSPGPDGPGPDRPGPGAARPGPAAARAAASVGGRGPAGDLEQGRRRRRHPGPAGEHRRPDPQGALGARAAVRISARLVQRAGLPRRPDRARHPARRDRRQHGAERHVLGRLRRPLRPEQPRGDRGAGALRLADDPDARAAEHGAEHHRDHRHPATSATSSSPAATS